LAFWHLHEFQRCFFLKNLAGFEPGSSVPEVDAMSTRGALIANARASKNLITSKWTKKRCT
jgi:hypothetical protein